MLTLLLVLALVFFAAALVRYIPMLRMIRAATPRRLLGAFALAVALAVCAPLAALAQEAATAAPADSGWLTNLWAYVSTPAAIAWLIGLAMAILPQGSSGTVWGMLRTLLDLVAANFGNAKNEPKT